MNKVFHYTDAIEGFPGWLVYDGTDCRLAVGGCRVQPGLDEKTLTALAERMSLKERLLRINADGAKCGIDYDPRAPGKAAALRRFLAFLRTEFAVRFSAGSDLGTRWPELERLAALEGIPSVKHRVRAAQELEEDDFRRRLRSLDEPTGALTLGERRAGHALAHAALTAARLDGAHRPDVALQGFGNLGRAAACSLAEAGARIVALADEHGTVSNPDGLDTAALLALPPGTPAHTAPSAPRPQAPEAVLDAPADVLVLAAGADALPAEKAARPQAPVVVVGANHGLAPDVQRLLTRHGVLVVPDFVGGAGGSASMEALFGPPRPLPPQAVLDRVTALTAALVTDIADAARRAGRPFADVAADFAARPVPDAGARPYGANPYLTDSLGRHC
ncbi:Glu/Leu/Phe/Val dehydrogenase dimerization domain-containing protein [Streptomyces sp. NPDC002677]|uniref:Glu/Leu/Phe/Val dehydrogenase dimerization domain-containing protein n=1 Tax=Streptomyces sp. NPDC002677 TaxID=3154774 RepID=UPI00332CF08E